MVEVVSNILSGRDRRANDSSVPMFARASCIPRAGVLLAIPALVASGLLSIAREIYRSLGPAFYGLRTTLVAYVLLALLRIPRPEALKEYAPDGLGRIVGLDRMPEVKTLRRKLARLAKMKGSQELGLELARCRVRDRGQPGAGGRQTVYRAKTPHQRAQTGGLSDRERLG